MKQVYALVFPVKYGAPLEIIKVEDFFERMFSPKMNDEVPTRVILNERYGREPVFSTDKDFLIEYAEDYICSLQERNEQLWYEAKVTKIKICEDDEK